MQAETCDQEHRIKTAMAAKKTSGKKGGKKGSKVSLAKLSNKHLNRLAKQGKLKKRLESKKFRRALQERTAPTARDPEQDEREEALEQEEGDIPLEEADYEFFAKPGRDLSFLRDVKDESDEPSKKRKKKNKKEEDDELERKYESSGRGTLGSEKEVKALLPIKDKHKVIPRTEEVEEEEEPEITESTETENADLEPEEPLPALSTAELFAQRQQKIMGRKMKMAGLACHIIENPEEHYGKLRELRLMLEDSEPDVMVTTKKLVMVTLMEVFKDIIPDYRIRVATDAEKEQAAKKETKKLRDFEESLVNNYRHYLEFLESVIKGKPPKSKDRKNRHKVPVVEIPDEAVAGLREVGIKCMCELLVSHPHFNFRTNIITAVVPYADSKNRKNSQVVCEHIKKIFKEDRSGEVTLEVVRLLGRIIKSRNYDVQPQVLNTFLALKIREVQKEEDKADNKEARREKIRKMSKKERKRHKQLGALEKELEDAAITDNKQKKLKLNTEIVNMIFLSYFRILKHGRDSVLLEPVLEGLAKFAHLINVEFFDDLFSVLTELVDSGELTYRESLHCVQTAFSILSGQGAALNVDPLRFYKHLYNVLLTLHEGSTNKDLPIALESLDMMINKRKKQVSLPRVLAFTKRLTTMACQLGSNGSIAVMGLIRAILNHFPKCDILYDLESQSSGLFMPELEDPEHCNANSTALWELAVLQRHYHPVVCQFASHLAVKAPSQGVGQLHPDLARKNPVGLFHQFDASEMEFNPEMREQKPRNRPGPIHLKDSLVATAAEGLLDNSAAIKDLDFHGYCTGRLPETSVADTKTTDSSAAPQPSVTKKIISSNKAKKHRFMAYKMGNSRKSRQ